MRAIVIALLCLLVVPPVAAGSVASPTARLVEAEALAASQAAVGREVADLGFVDSEGRPVRLRDFRGRPVLLNLVYTSCGDTCPLVVEHIARAVQVADGAFGAGRFVVLTTGFDARFDTAARMRSYAEAHGISRADWRFLSANSATIDRLAADVGFLFVPRAGGFEHTTQVTLLDQEGRVYRQIYGESFPAQALVEPLKELVYGMRPAVGLGDLINRFRLLCTVYDPAAGRYRFSYAIFIEIGVGIASLVVVGLWVARLWRQTGRA